MSKFMPKSVAGHFDAPAGATMKTQPYNQLPALPEFIGQMDANNHTAFTSINEATAYFQHLKKSILNLNNADFLAHVGADYYEHIVRYIIISGLILMSEMRDDIECKVSYIRIADDDLSPYKPDLIFPLASKYFNELLNEWAEFIDPNLEAFDSTTATKIRMLCVVLLNDVPVAYYSPDSIMFYPFKTITSSPDKAENLPGVDINSNNEWVFSLPDFQAICQAVGYLTTSQRQILASKLNNLSSLPNTGNGFSLIMDILNLHFVGVVAPPYVDVPVKMSVYTIPGTHPVSRSIESQEMPLLNTLGHLLAVPMENQKAEAIEYTPGNLSRDIYHALGFSVPKCTIFNDAATGQQWLMVSEVENCSFSYNGQLVTTAGLLITPPLAVPPAGAPQLVPLNLEVTYVPNAKSYHLGDISFSCNVTTKKVAFDIPNQKLSFFIAGKGGMLNPFISKYWEGVDNLLPVTKEFIRVIKACGYQLGRPSILANGTDIQIEIPIEDNIGTAVDIIKHTYSKDFIIEYGASVDIGAGHQAHAIMPQLSVYPYHRFEDTKKISLWNKYFFSALIYDPKSYEYFRTLNFTYDSIAGADVTLDINKNKKVMLSTNEDYTGYRTSAPVIPNYIYITDNQGVELGTMYIPKPPVTIVNPASNAVVGIDMGSRNSIVATYNVNMGNINYIYSTCDLKGKPLNYIFCNYIPCNDAELAEMDEACNMFGSPTSHVANCENSFISSVLDYINIPGDKYEPYEHGRLIADLEDATYQKILDMATKLGKAVIHPMDDIGLHNGFKEKLYRLTMGMDLPPEVELFIKNACYQMVLNAFCEGCGNISLNFTAPDDDTGNILQTTWQDAINNQKILFDIPATINITAAPYMLESAAIFYNLSQIVGMEGVHQYAITIDAGDSTFDVSVFSCDKGAVKHNLNETFSIKYAGKRLIVESIIDVCKANKVTSTVFCNLWGTVGMMHGKKALPTPEPFVKTITDANNDIDWDKDSTKDVIYKLIENFGLNIFIATPLEKPIMEKIKNFINLKYCLMLNAILETCISILPSGDIVDPTITVAFYGGTNNVANLLYNNPTCDLKNLMDSWLPTYANNAGITGTDVKFNVKGAQSGKQDLVNGLVRATPAPMTKKLIHVADGATDYSHDIYFNTISQIFPKPKDGQTSPYWELDATGNYTCILDIPENIISNIPAVAAKSFANIENDVKKSFLLPAGAPPLNLPTELIYPLYTFFLAIEKFKNINGI